MKICRICDEYYPELGDLGYLLYFENTHRFYIEIADGLDYWYAPPIMDWYIEHGIEYVDAEWSLKWVQNRIIPPDRQNIAQILINQGMDSYNEYRMLVYSDGRCAQDDCMVEEIHEKDLPEYIIRRRERHVRSVFPLHEHRVMVFFIDGTSCVVDVNSIVGKDPRFTRILRETDVFSKVYVSEGGYGICWDEQREIPFYELKINKTDYMISYDDMRLIIEHETLDTAQTAERLNCSRQNIDDLVKRDKLRPVKTGAKSKLFMRSEVEERLW